jgi:hypothetical protein
MLYLPNRPNYKSIKMQTRLLNDIINLQINDFSESDKDYIKELAKFQGVKFRNKPIATYNCHGFTFGCSRTWIYPQSIEMILNDDGYVDVQLDKVLPGDVIIYYDANNEVLHSGIVVSCPKNEQPNIPWVVSKWGKFSEVCHQVYNVPRHYMPVKVRFCRVNRHIGE